MSKFNSHEYLRSLHAQQIMNFQDKIYKVRSAPSIISSNEQNCLSNKQEEDVFNTKEIKNIPQQKTKKTKLKK